MAFTKSRVRARRPGASTAGLAAVCAFVVACRSASTTPRSELRAPALRASAAAPTRSASAVPRTPSPSAVAPTSSAERPGVTASALAARPTVKGSDPNLFACGETSCKSREEACCTSGDTSICVPSLPRAPGDPDPPPRVDPSQSGACRAALGEFAGDVTSCDESSDCASDEVCCNQAHGGGTVQVGCVPIGSGKTAPCQAGELCHEGKPCRFGNTECVDGQCRKRLERLRCGSSYCGPGSSCCDVPPRCMPHAQCKRCWPETSECEPLYPVFQCARRRDCLNGEECWWGGGRTKCYNYPPISGVAARVCGSEADCPADEFVCEGKKMRCKGMVEEAPHLRLCECP